MWKGYKGMHPWKAKSQTMEKLEKVENPSETDSIKFQISSKTSRGKKDSI